jgi:hypothetical protein
MKCPYCNEELTEYKNYTTFEKLYYCGTEDCPKTYRVLASKTTWQLLTKLLKEKTDEQTLA